MFTAAKVYYLRVRVKLNIITVDISNLALHYSWLFSTRILCRLERVKRCDSLALGPINCDVSARHTRRGRKIVVRARDTARNNRHRKAAVSAACAAVSVVVETYLYTTVVGRPLTMTPTHPLRPSTADVRGLRADPPADSSRGHPFLKMGVENFDAWFFDDFET